MLMQSWAFVLMCDERNKVLGHLVAYKLSNLNGKCRCVYQIGRATALINSSKLQLMEIVFFFFK